MVVAAALLACSRNRAPAPEPHVADPSSKRTIASGELVGYADKNGKAQGWLGIPFAAPPTGELRWRAPQKPAAWSGVRESLRFASACPQLANILGDAPDAKPGSVIGSEDCLYLNVYAPRGSAEEAAKRKLPVMFWIHGGGNTVGHAGGYDGSELAARYDVVVVTTNYRLGPFGWFRHAALVGDATGDDASGNWGTLDLIRGLEWVRENAAAFGGDPQNVTIFGESAGGTDVFSLLVSPRAKGLFQRAISESGGSGSSSLEQAEAADKRNSSGAATARIVPEAKSLAPNELASRLRAATPAQIFAAFGFCRIEFPRKSRRLAKHVLGKRTGQPVFPDDGQHVHTGRPGAPEHFENVALRIDMTRRPGVQLGHHLVPDHREQAQHRGNERHHGGQHADRRP
jgi:para-nitrobenzyl esterase